VSDYSGLIRPNDQDPTTIGRPYEYSVIVTARDLRTYGTELRWSQITWSRVLDEISEATVVVPDRFFGPNCLIELGGSLIPWRFGIRIERNGELVWSGPIVNISRPVRDGVGQDYIAITAQDKMTWMRKRLFPSFRSYTNVDAGEIFQQSVLDGTAADNFFGLFCPPFTTNLTMTREIVPLDLEYVSSVLDDLASSAVDWFVIGDDLAVYDRGSPAGWYVQRAGQKFRLAPTPDSEGRYLYGVFTDNAWIERPGYELDGESQANDVYIAGAESGPDGFGALWTSSDVDPLDGLLSYVDVNPLYRPQVAVEKNNSNCYFGWQFGVGCPNFDTGFVPRIVVGD